MSSRQLFLDPIFTKTFGYQILDRIWCVKLTIECDKNAVGVFKSGDKETLVGHLPIEISCLLTYLLKATPENKLDKIVADKRKPEVRLVVSVKYAGLAKNKAFANALLKKLQEK